MATLSKNTQDNEQRKFAQCGDKVVVQTEICQKDGESLLVNPLNNILGGIYFDAIEFNYPDQKTEVFTYYNGGAGGDIVATVTVVYYDTGKRKIKSVAKT